MTIQVVPQQQRPQRRPQRRQKLLSLEHLSSHLLPRRQYVPIYGFYLG